MRKSVFSALFSALSPATRRDLSTSEEHQQSVGAPRYALVDLEVGVDDKKIHDIGALRHDGATYHDKHLDPLWKFLEPVDFLCGHNLLDHDARHLFAQAPCRWQLVDTLHASALLFPERPYHHLVKDEKLRVDELNNPVADCQKAKELLDDEIAAWHRLPADQQQLLADLLHATREFAGFFRLLGVAPSGHDVTAQIAARYEGRICQHADLAPWISSHPVALAYALVLLDTTDHRSITPGWVLHTYPEVENIVQLLRQTPCAGCPYCHAQLDVVRGLQRFFGYPAFRTYEGEPLQERAARAAVEGRSLLAIFPTGGGKSLTFQLPALMAGQTMHGLTVVISPLQSLMKDQVDTLAHRGITDAVTINGMLDPISRALAIERVQNGDATLLYIAPEMLR